VLLLPFKLLLPCVLLVLLGASSRYTLLLLGSVQLLTLLLTAYAMLGGSGCVCCCVCCFVVWRCLRGLAAVGAGGLVWLVRRRLRPGSGGGGALEGALGLSSSRPGARLRQATSRCPAEDLRVAAPPAAAPAAPGAGALAAAGAPWAHHSLACIRAVASGGAACGGTTARGVWYLGVWWRASRHQDGAHARTVMCGDA
jgi:hypothetical protein